MVIAQAQKLWKVKEEHLKPYKKYLEDLTKTFDKIEYTIICRAQNQFADVLATLASMVEILERVWTRPLTRLSTQLFVEHKINLQMS